jgi:hypothetical protein
MFIMEQFTVAMSRKQMNGKANEVNKHNDLLFSHKEKEIM